MNSKAVFLFTMHQGDTFGSVRLSVHTLSSGTGSGHVKYMATPFFDYLTLKKQNFGSRCKIQHTNKIST